MTPVREAAVRPGRERERRLRRPDGRDVAWLEAGPPEGQPILRLPGTPGSRLQVRSDQSVWVDRGLRIVMTERPGFGASSPDSRLSWARHADDLAAILDALGLDSIPIYGGSGAAPYLLAFTARHPDRVKAVTIVVGAAPVEPNEAIGLIELNADGHRFARAGDRAGMVALLTPQRTALLADPLVAFRAVMDRAPAHDQAIIGDPSWQAMLVRGMREALRQGVDAWVDESMLMLSDWAEFDPREVKASVTWWHGTGDRNIPLSAARRLVSRLPNATLAVWPDDGHLTPYLREGDVLDELLARA
jgi:pimeloyl-ACP methyl ester carboxylesterase